MEFLWCGSLLPTHSDKRVSARFTSWFSGLLGETLSAWYQSSFGISLIRHTHTHTHNGTRQRWCSFVPPYFRNHSLSKAAEMFRLHSAVYYETAMSDVLQLSEKETCLPSNTERFNYPTAPNTQRWSTARNLKSSAPFKMEYSLPAASVASVASEQLIPTCCL